MMKKKLFVLLTVVCILALATACGSQTSGTDTDSNAGTQSGAQQEESTLTGKLDEKKDFMFVVTDDQGASYSRRWSGRRCRCSDGHAIRPSARLRCSRA